MERWGGLLILLFTLLVIVVAVIALDRCPLPEIWSNEMCEMPEE